MSVSVSVCGSVYCLHFVYKVKDILLLNISWLAGRKIGSSSWISSMEHISQCNHSESLADARGKIVDLMNEHEILRAHHVYFFNQICRHCCEILVDLFVVKHLPTSPIKTHHYIISFVDHHILNREWRVIVDQVQTNYHGRPIVL